MRGTRSDSAAAEGRVRPGSRWLVSVASAAFFGFGLAGCGGGDASVSGTVLGIAFGDTKYVFMGGPYITISNIEVECEQLAFVQRSYEEGQQATTDEMQLLQFAYATDLVTEGNNAIDVSASVSSIVVKSNDANFEFTRAESGSINVESFTENEEASGTFDSVTFQDGGVLTGTFSAEWCRNLRDR